MVRPAHLRADRTVWDRARSDLAGLPTGGVNIAYEAVGRHVVEGNGDRIALRCLARDGSRRDVSYAELAERSGRFADVLDTLGVGGGDAVVVLLERVPELFVSVLGTLERGAVVVPLSSAYGPEPIRRRIDVAKGRVLVTAPRLYERRVSSERGRLPDLEHVLLVGDDAVDDPAAGMRALAPMLARASGGRVVARTDPSEVALLQFTSGTTGVPKAAIHVHEAVAAHRATAITALGLRPGDVYWCTADPGWVTGMSYGIIAPLCCGATCIVDEAGFDAARWISILADEQVNVWYTAPTAVRLLMRSGPDLVGGRDLTSLRLAATVGEPLDADAVRWSETALGTPCRDTWWQTETGAIMIANPAVGAPRPGSMGRPLPGVEVAVLRAVPDAEGGVVVEHGRAVVAELGERGHLALRPPWPSMFRGYLGAPDQYDRSFVDGWYVTGDLASIDDDGWVWFAGRADDMIKSGGHLVGPFEVESVLLEHPAVVDAGVVGTPDPVAGEIVKAYVSVAEGVVADERLVADLVAHARRRLGPVAAPRRIAFDQHLPRTANGKVARRVLRARDRGLGSPDGPTSEHSST